MIEKLVQNKKQKKILLFMLVRPERAFFADEIKKKTGGAAGFDAALTGLVKAGFLISFRKRGIKYVMLNSKHGFYQQFRGEAIRALRRKTDDELQKLLKRLPGLKAIVLAGLFVGNAKGDCDLVLAGNFSQARLNGVMGKVENLMGQEINYAVFEPGEYNYRKNIFDRFMKNIFEGDHLVLMDKVKD